MKRLLLLILIATACSQNQKEEAINLKSREVLHPLYVTDTVNYDSDDPAIWINKKQPNKSLIIGTDKMEHSLGGIYSFHLDGKIDTMIVGLDRPNNVDLAYGFILGNDTLDIAVVTERVKAQIRVLSIPSMEFIDNGGIPVFEDDSENAVMGVGIYKRPSDNAFFVIISRKGNKDNNNDYLYQYQLIEDSLSISAKLVRKFGDFSGQGEIEAIAVDNELGYIYYSDEGHGIRKYYADPSKGNKELAVFGLNNFAEDREGISIYKSDDSKGYILISDQQANEFHVYPREGTSEDPHAHPLLKEIRVQSISSDGSEVTSIKLGEEFQNGLFVSMSDNKTFEIYSWDQFDHAIKEESKSDKKNL